MVSPARSCRPSGVNEPATLSRSRLAKEGSVGSVAHKPDRRLGEPKDVLLGFLDYYRSVIARKTGG